MLCVALHFFTFMSGTLVHDFNAIEFAINKEHSQARNGTAKIVNSVDGYINQLEPTIINKRIFKNKSNGGRRKEQRINNRRDYADFSLLSPKEILKNVSLYKELSSYKKLDFSSKITQETYELIQSVLSGFTKLSLKDINEKYEANKIEIPRIFCVFNLLIALVKVYSNMRIYYNTLYDYGYDFKHVGTPNHDTNFSLYQYVEIRLKGQKKMYMDLKKKFLNMALKQEKYIESKWLNIDDNIQ